jgi:hypothetical protein
MKQLQPRKQPPHWPDPLLNAWTRALSKHLAPAIAATLTGNAVLTGVSSRTVALTRLALEIAVLILIAGLLWRPSHQHRPPLPA